MTPDQIATFLTSGDLYLVLAVFCFLIVRVLDVYTPALSKRIAAGVVSVVTPVCVALSSGLLSHFPPLKLATLALAAFFGSAILNKVVPPKPSQDAPTDPTKIEAARKVVNDALDKKVDPPKSALRILGVFAICFFAVVGATSCTAQQGAAVVSAVVPIVEHTACDIAETQTNSALVDLICSEFDKKGTPIRSYKATLPKAKLAACPKTDGKLAP